MTDGNLYSEFEALKQENEKLKEGLVAIKKQLEGFQLMSESNGFLDQCSCSIFLLKNLRGILARSEIANINIEDKNITESGADPSNFDGVLSSPASRSTRKRSLVSSPEISEGRKRFNADEQWGNSGNSINNNNNNTSSADLLMNPMDPFNFGSMDSSQQGNSHEIRQFQIQQCLQSFQHANQCNNSSQCSASCQKMKLVIQHVRACQRKTSQFSCPICKNLVTVCCYHAKTCQQSNCHLPFCATIKEKLRQKKQQHLQRMQNLIQMNSQQDSFMTASSSTSSSSVFSTVESELNSSEHVELPPSSIADDDTSHLSHLEDELNLVESTEPNPSEPPTVKVEYFQEESINDPLASIKYDNNTFYY